MLKSRRDFFEKSIIGFTSFSIAPVFEHVKRLSGIPILNDKKIIYRTLGKTGVKLPVVSMGVMNASLPDLIPASYELGVRHFDTAMSYQSGKNEEMIGQQIKEMGVREKVTIATKIGLPKGIDNYTNEELKKYFITSFDGCLKRLQSDYVDILYIHNVSDTKSMNIEPIKEALLELKDKKKVKFIGVSTHKNMSEVLNEATVSKFYDVVLTSINFTMSNDIDLLSAIKKASDSGIGVIAMKTQGGGRWYKDRSPDNFKGKMNATAVLKWALRVEGVVTAIPGYTNFDHMTEDFSVAYNLEYTEEEIEFLKDKNVLYGAAFCRQCEKCLSYCPNKVDIPSLMRTSMYLMQYSNIYEAKNTLNMIDNGRGISNCIGCDSCKAVCNNRVNIGERIKDLKVLFA